MNNSFILVTGGRRSGKTAHAMELAEKAGKKRLYIATAEALDEEMKERIARHRAERGDGWDTAEEPLDVKSAIENSGDYDVIMIDCLTLWLCNIMHKNPPSPPFDKGGSEGAKTGDCPAFTEGAEHSRRMGTVPETRDGEIIHMVDALARACRESSAQVIAVTNELGLGVIPDNKLSRQFTDLAGIMNQRMAKAAGKVIMTVSGIPITIKDKK